MNTGTCLLAGVVTFSILGHMAHNQGVPVANVVNSGPGLVFITYPEVVLKMTGGSVWAVIFFFMLVVIGIDSEFCIVESLVTGIVDMYPETLRFITQNPFSLAHNQLQANSQKVHDRIVYNPIHPRCPYGDSRRSLYFPTR